MFDLRQRCIKYMFDIRLSADDLDSIRNNMRSYASCNEGHDFEEAPINGEAGGYLTVALGKCNDLYDQLTGTWHVCGWFSISMFNKWRIANHWL